MRITRPIRSLKCTHIQCFDAYWWIESNNQHPQWLCPLCSRELQFDDLMVDGYVVLSRLHRTTDSRSYFLDILNTVPDSVDEVVIESAGEWHTEDNKFGAPSWLSTHRPTTITNGATPSAPRPPEPSAEPKAEPDSDPPDPKGKRKAIEILSSDDDEDDVPLSRVNGHSPSHQPSMPPPPGPPSPPAQNPSTSSARQPSQPANTGGVIDLTLDSSDEEDDADDPTYFCRPDVGYSSRAHADDDSTRTRLEYESDFRLTGFGAGDSGELGWGDVGGGGTGDHWSPWSGGDAEKELNRYGKRVRPTASDWLDEDDL